MNKRDLKADLDWVAVLEKVITQATVEKERVDRIEALAREELVETLGRKGCNYCLKTNPEYAGYSDIWHDNKLSIGYGNYIEINFCPMCGRYLRVKACDLY